MIVKLGIDFSGKLGVTAMATITTQDSPYQILLAEDSAADVAIVRLALRDQNLNHILHVARDGEEAIAFIEKADNDSKAPGPDLLLLHASAAIQWRANPAAPEIDRAICADTRDCDDLIRCARG